MACIKIKSLFSLWHFCVDECWYNFTYYCANWDIVADIYNNFYAESKKAQLKWTEGTPHDIIVLMLLKTKKAYNICP